MRLALALLLAGIAACATTRQDQTVCAEFRDLRCAARLSCAMDRSRGCKVCQCEPAAPAGPDGNPGLPAPPSRG